MAWEPIPASNACPALILAPPTPICGMCAVATSTKSNYAMPLLTLPMPSLKHGELLTVKYATALRLGTADTESILQRFTRNNLQHPTYQALAELGRAIKTIFLSVPRIRRVASGDP